MMTVGDPLHHGADGTHCEARFFLESALVAIVHGDVLRSYNFNHGTLGVGLLEMRLEGPRGGGLAKITPECSKATLEVWIEEGGGLPKRIARACVDHWLMTFDGDHEKVAIQGRSPGAVLVDEQWLVTFDGDLAGLMTTAFAGRNLPFSMHDVPGRSVAAHIDAPSAYGALRLVASAMGLVVRDRDDGFHVFSRKALFEESQKRPVAQIRGADIKSGGMERGAPIRKR